MTLTPGMPIIWVHRPRGGYCYPTRVLARFVCENRRLVRIDALLSGERAWKTVNVERDNLREPTGSERARIEAAIAATGRL